MATLPVHFERIERFWLAAPLQQRISDGVANYGYDWTHGSFDWLKVTLNARLRQRQHDRCCYCRRPLVFDKGHVEIDHIVDKGSQQGTYARFTFEARNLALACKDCNNNKGTKSVLARALVGAAAPYPTRATAFTWVHPHFHRYSEHITIHEGWIYEATNQSKSGLAVIKHCKLDKLKDKERANRRVLVSGTASLQDAVLRAVGMVQDVGLDHLCRELGPHLATIWKSHTPADVSRAIQQAHAAVQAIVP